MSDRLVMEAVEGARSFATTGDAYDAFMGRYSRPLADVFADEVEVAAGHSVLDIGCGPGALTGVLVDRVGAAGVAAVDPSEMFVAACRTRFPDVDVRLARAETLPFEDASFDRALSQLVLHFVSDAAQVAREMRRVVRPGGIAAANVWDFAEGMQMLRAFWDAAMTIVPSAPDEAASLRFGGQGEIAELFAEAGFEDIVESTLDVASTYQDFDELWAGFLLGIGPAGSFVGSLPDAQRARLRTEFHGRVGSPTGAFTLTATARYARGRNPQ